MTTTCDESAFDGHNELQRWVASLSSTSDEESLCSRSSDGYDSDLPIGTIISQPFKIHRSDELGRYLVAERDIKAGEIIMMEPPLVVAPMDNTDYLCIACYQRLDEEKVFKCFGCRWTLCGAGCKGLYHKFGHTAEECEMLHRHRSGKYFNESSVKKRSQMYNALFALRVLLVKRDDKRRGPVLSQMEHHNDLRKEDHEYWNRNQQQIVNKIRDDWKLKEFSEMEIHTACGIIDINCFGIGHHGASARALYWNPTLMAHNCQPNTAYVDDPKTRKLIVRSTKPIKKGEQLTDSYLYILDGTMKRRSHLHKTKFFWCQCQRCSDPTEFKTYISAMFCPNCKDGLLLTTKALDHEADWACQNCDYRVSGYKADKVARILERELAQLCEFDHDGLLAFIDKYQYTLHKNHYIMLAAEYPICLRSLKGCEMNTVSSEKLRIKEKYCRHLAEVMDKLDPGQARLKGLIAYELHFSILIQATRQLNRRKISRTKFMSILEEVKTLLSQASQILGMEPEGSKEFDLSVDAGRAAVHICKILNNNC